MSKPRFTVLMPTHYRPDTIGYAIRSVLAQSASDFELLVVGDGANAETAQVVQGFSDTRIKWFDLPKAPGYGYANRNIAMEQSTGELVVFAADDDLMFPDHLERLGRCFDERHVQWAYSQALWVSTDGIAAPDLTNLQNGDERTAFLRGNTISGGSLMFRASAFPSRRCWPEHVQSAGDWEQMKWLLQEYGLAGMRRLREPSFLHFTAGSKSNHRDSGNPILAAWLSLADKADWWPTTLKPVVVDRLPQAAYWQLLEHDAAFTDKLRTAATDICNRVALAALSPRWPVEPVVNVELLQGELVALQGQLQQANADVAVARSETEAIRASTSWRFFGPARWLVQKLRGRRP